MRWIFTAKRDAISDQERTGLPRRILRLLIERMNVGIGSCVLIVGPDDNGIAPFLRGLGMQVTHAATDLCAASGAAAASDRQPRFVDPAEWHPRRGKHDAALVTRIGEFDGSVFSTAVMEAVGWLLQSIPPGGRLIALPQSNAEVPSVKHSAQCVSRLFRAFSRQVQVDDLRPSDVEWLCTLIVPTAYRLDREWIEQAEARIGSHHPACCENALHALAPKADAA